VPAAGANIKGGRENKKIGKGTRFPYKVDPHPKKPRLASQKKKMGGGLETGGEMLTEKQMWGQVPQNQGSPRNQKEKLNP